MISDLAGVLAPLMAVAALWCLTPTVMRSWIWMHMLLAAVLLALLGRYLWWRLTVTTDGASLATAEGAFVWTLLVIETLAWIDAMILVVLLLRRRDRNTEADAHEARLRATDPARFPVVDVFIATYNEGRDVLEKTLVGATRLDWPADRLRVHVLDDGRRDWVGDLARAAGAAHVTRADNAHAKAGNINAALVRTTGEFILVLDADFVPQRNMLMRMMGFFDDPKVGIVQAPHTFFNADPVQAGLNLRDKMPDDQRFFFDDIMRGRDGWGVAFCCGSNGILRRSAMEEIGGGLPTGSITEDMLLTLAMLRKGRRTVYLHEPLALGLAPESLGAFFVQRARWARGALQMLFLRDGPLGPGLTFAQRIFFMPSHWLVQSLAQSAAMATPAVFMLTGMRPLLNASLEDVLSYQIPALVLILLLLRWMAPRNFFPLAATVLGVLQAFRLLPVVLGTLVKPFGHAFKVTPKGADARGGMARDLPTLMMSLGLVAALILGLALASDPDWHGDALAGMVPVVVGWTLINVAVLLVVSVVAITPPALRQEERFEWSEPTRLRLRAPAHHAMSAAAPDGPVDTRQISRSVSVAQECAPRPTAPPHRAGGATEDLAHGPVALPLVAEGAGPDRGGHSGSMIPQMRCPGDDWPSQGAIELAVTGLDLSLTGAAVQVPEEAFGAASCLIHQQDNPAQNGVAAEILVPDIGWIAAEVVRVWNGRDGTRYMGLIFTPIPAAMHTALIERLYTRGARAQRWNSDALTQSWRMLAGAFNTRRGT